MGTKAGGDELIESLLYGQCQTIVTHGILSRYGIPIQGPFSDGHVPFDHTIQVRTMIPYRIGTLDFDRVIVFGQGIIDQIDR